MDNTTNDDRLKILQERLAQIKQKREKPTIQHSQDTNTTEASAPETVIPETTTEKNQQEKRQEKKDPSWGLEEKKKKSHTIKYFIFLICVGLGVYIYTNLDSLSSDAEVVSEEKTPFVLKYNFKIDGSQLAIINSFKDESSAKAMVNDLTIKGFKCDYFFLPNKSNSTEEVFKVFIGPYESLEEANQWKQNVSEEVEILNL